jgi:LCP family protein required for cell wall assembly
MYDVPGRRAGDPTAPRRDGPRHARASVPVPGDDGGGDGRRDDRPKRRRTWPQRLVLTVGTVLVAMCVLGASVAGYALVKYESIDRVDNLEGLTSAPAGEPENYLIVAPDYREGQETKNTDTIMVVRVDPRSDRLAVTSFPRDLMVRVADTGETGQINAVYNREGDQGPNNLIETLRLNYDISIQHFVEVSFDSFRQVVDAVGGVDMWMPVAARDPGSGFYNEQLGCVRFDGEHALQFVRSRKLEIQDQDGDWDRELQSDVNRVQRQQIFIERAMARVLADVKSNPLRVRELVDIGTSTVRLDPNLGITDILDLADHFQAFDSGNLETYALPTVPYPADDDRLLLDEADAEPMLNVFRGLAPGEIRPGLVTVTVLNGTVADGAQQREGLATDVSGALQRVGFEMGSPGDAETFYPQTTIEYAPGQAAYAQRVARHITSTVAIPTVENPELDTGHVRLIAGLDFTTVHDQPTPIDSMPAAPGAPASTTTTATDDTTTTTTAAPPVTTAPSTDPYIMGAPPAGADC